MFEINSPEKQKAALADTLKVIDGLLALADLVNKTGESLQMDTAVAQSEALKTQFGNLAGLAKSNEIKYLAATRMSELVTKYSHLPPKILEQLKKEIFQLFPEQPKHRM